MLLYSITVDQCVTRVHQCGNNVACGVILSTNKTLVLICTSLGTMGSLLEHTSYKVVSILSVAGKATVADGQNYEVKHSLEGR